MINKIFLKAQVECDDITETCSNKFDYVFTGLTEVEIPFFDVPNDYQIGLIVGPSGSGKSTILSKIGSVKKIVWSKNKAICSAFKDSEEAMEKLGSVGLNSIPSWMKPYHVLSTGEKFRADLSRRLHNDSVIDEFTSVVDRKVAVSCSFALQRYIRNKNIQRVTFATCHYDVIEWLQPDWVYDTQTQQLMLGRGVERRPEIKLEVVPCTTKAWSMFSNHHYLNSNINKSARCWLVSWGDEIVGFTAILPFPSGSLKNGWREHRTVILPEFQGLGFGVRVSDAIGKIVISNGGRYFSKTASDRMGMYRENNSAWRPTSKNKKCRPDYAASRLTKESKYKHKHELRVCFSHEYIG